MTREKCEAKIKELLMEIKETVLEYNPRNDYLCVAVCNGITSVHFSNPWCEEGCEDRERPLDLLWCVFEEEEHEA